MPFSIYLERETLLDVNLGNHETEQEAVEAVNALMRKCKWKAGDSRVVIAEDLRITKVFPLRSKVVEPFRWQNECCAA